MKRRAFLRPIRFRALAAGAAMVLMLCAPAQAKDYVGEMQSYTAKYEDTMVQIARTFNVGFVELRSANPSSILGFQGRGKG